MKWESTFKIIKGLAYTQDHYLIYNLILPGLPAATTESDVFSYFKKFGKLLNVQFLKFEAGDQKTCVIYFANAQAAAEALVNSKFPICNMGIKACHSYYQPAGQKLMQQLEANLQNNSLAVVNEVAQRAASILNLNDDCLEHICKMLTPIDQVNFAISCPRFCNILIMASRVQYANVNTKDLISEWPLLTIWIFFKIVGPQIKTLDINNVLFNLQEILYSFSFCTNVEKLKVIFLSTKVYFLQKFIINMHHLEDLDLSAPNIDNNFIKYLQRFSKLKSLRLAFLNYVTIGDIQQLKGLQKLTLYKCDNFTVCDLRNICQKLENLQYLDIRQNYFNDALDYNCITEHLPQLKVFKTSCIDGNFNFIINLPKLAELLIEIYGDTINEEFSANLTKVLTDRWHAFKLSINARNLPIKKLLEITKLNQLKFIEFLRWKFYDKHILDLLKNNLQLQHISFKNCTEVTKELAHKMLKLLQEQWAQGLRRECVNLYIRRALKHKHLKSNCFELNEISDILKINYV